MTGAFVSRVRVEGAVEGPLAGLSFASRTSSTWPAYPRGAGTRIGRVSPGCRSGMPGSWRRCWRLVPAWVGKTVTDEVSLGILGENAFDGTPVNPAAPGRVPGGSSSGSASAVAAGECDFALGTDSGGSVRVPSSFCGLYGIRPTHGRIDFSGITVQAPSADTCGWFARDAATFARVGAVLCGEAVPDALPTTLLVATDAFGFAEEAVQAALAPLVERLAGLFSVRREVTMAPQGLSVWQRAQRVLQSSEAWRTFEPWLDTCNPRMAWSVARGLVQGSMFTDQERSAATLMRIEARARLRDLLPAGTILCLPTTPFPPPLKGLQLSVLGPLRERISCLTSHGGLTGVPQVNLPGATVDGLPVGLSIVGGRGMDMSLMRVALAFAGS